MQFEIIDRYFKLFFVEIKLKKQNLKSGICASEFGRPNRYTDLTNGLDTSLKETEKHKREIHDKKMIEKYTTPTTDIAAFTKILQLKRQKSLLE